jgi:osmotically-inducible protein OsmY
MSRVGMIALIAASAFGLQGCLVAVAGGAGEAGYIASQDRSATTTISDQLITSKVKTKLIADDSVKARNVNVDTYAGVVTLRGIVFSSKQRARAKDIAGTTKGVKKVVSHLEISE